MLVQLYTVFIVLNVKYNESSGNKFVLYDAAYESKIYYYNMEPFEISMKKKKKTISRLNANSISIVQCYILI